MAVHNIAEFGVWRPYYGGATVTVKIAGTNTNADLFTDEGLSVSAANPQTLQTLTQNGISYGKFQNPLYTASPYYLDIDSQETTGVERPALTSLSGENASDATVTPTGGSQATALDNLFARAIDVRDYGVFLPTSDGAASAATNNTTLTSAIGVAAAAGGGVVRIPAGTYKINSVTLSGDVILEGQGREATIIQSETGDKVFTLSGDRAGFRRLTLDGVSLQAGSVGVYGLAKDETVFDDVQVKRFVTGVHCPGGRRAQWRDLYIDNCTTGAKLHGDADASNTGNGDEFRHNRWTGGRVTNCTGIGVDLSYEDRKCWHNALIDIGFENNTGVALNINGARFTEVHGCWWAGNTTNLEADDDDDTDAADENTVIGLFLRAGSMSGGAATLSNTMQDTVFEAMELSDVDFTLTLVTNNILVLDCIEDASVTIAGQGTKWTRWRRTNAGTVSGETTDGTATKAWSLPLAPGQVGYFEAIVVGNQRNGENSAEYHISVSAERPGSELAYDTQTANFTLGDVLTGGTSGATGRIVADSDSGATGTLTLRSIDGEFEDNEIIADESGGSATANGTLTGQNVALLGSNANLRAVREDVTGWGAAFAANGPEIELQVTGASSTTIDWEVYVKAVVNG